MNNTIVFVLGEEVDYNTEVFFTGVGKVNAPATTEQVTREYKPKISY